MTDDLHKHVGMFFSGDGHFHLFGTDYLGRDMFARIWRGARISLLSHLLPLSLMSLLGLFMVVLLDILVVWLIIFNAYCRNY